MYHPYTGSKNKKRYHEYIINTSTELGLLPVKNHSIVTISKPLLNKRTHKDLYNIIMYLSRILHIMDIVKDIVGIVVSNEPSSTREWYMGIYDIMHEKQTPLIFSNYLLLLRRAREGLPFFSVPWTDISLPPGPFPRNQHETSVNAYLYYTLSARILKRHTNPHDPQSWIKSPCEPLSSSTILYAPTEEDDYIPEHYYRIVNHVPPQQEIRKYWKQNEDTVSCRGESPEWSRTILLIPYVPYKIQWNLLPDCKYSQEFIENNRNKMTEKKIGHYKFSPKSPWVRIECGNRFYYKHRYSSKKQRLEPKCGFSNINVADIYYFDTQYPLLIFTE